MKGQNIVYEYSSKVREAPGFNILTAAPSITIVSTIGTSSVDVVNGS